MNPTIETLYRAALRADANFTLALEAVYGAAAGDARYLTHHADPRVEAAMNEKLAADAAYHVAVVAVRHALP